MMGTRAFALAQYAATDEQLHRSPLKALAISDSLHAVALTFLAGADSAAHAHVETHMLRQLRVSTIAANRSAAAAESRRSGDSAHDLPLGVTLTAASA
jgi:hypothetical protein